jgi:putative peptide zinc metalloprotease protein
MPFLRFDGYFLLMDWTAIPNLHARAFSMGTWWLREQLLGLAAPAPEAFPDQIRKFLIGFALSTWVYRLVLFTGIAFLVHGLFPAPLGIFLGTVEIYWFVLRPVVRELGSWPSLLGTSGVRALLGKGGLLLLAMGFLFLFPWDSRVSGPAALMPAERFPLVAEAGGRISFLGSESGHEVDAGQRLIELHRPELDYELAALEARIKSIRAQLRGAALQDDRREEGQVLQATLARLEAERDELIGNVAEGIVTAPFGGRVYWSDLAYGKGSWIARGEQLGELISREGLRLDALLGQRAVERIELGDSARFFFESGARAPLTFTVASIDEDAMAELSFRLLSTEAGGSVGVREQHGRLIPEQPVYRVQLESSSGENIEPGVFRGRVVIQGAREAWIAPYADAFLATLRRELTF